jgi:hypothetical protein
MECTRLDSTEGGTLHGEILGSIAGGWVNTRGTPGSIQRGRGAGSTEGKCRNAEAWTPGEGSTSRTNWLGPGARYGAEPKLAQC